MNTKEPQNRGISELLLQGVFSSGYADNKWITLTLGFPMTTKPYQFFSVFSTLNFFPLLFSLQMFSLYFSLFHTIPKDQI